MGLVAMVVSSDFLILFVLLTRKDEALLAIFHFFNRKEKKAWPPLTFFLFYSQWALPLLLSLSSLLSRTLPRIPLHCYRVKPRFSVTFRSSTVYPLHQRYWNCSLLPSDDPSPPQPNPLLFGAFGVRPITAPGNLLFPSTSPPFP